MIRLKQLRLAMLECCAGMAVFALAAGYGGPEGAADRQPTAPATGIVTHIGKPVEGATITFVPAINPVPAYGITDAEGKFELTTYEQDDGAIVGEHFVTINKTTGATPPSGPPSTGNEDPEDFENYNPPSLGVTPPPVVQHLLPERYSRPDTSGLTATPR